MGMYDDIVTGVSENIEIGGYPFFAENIDGDEPFNRRDYTFKPILNGTLSSKRGKYIQRKFSFKTTLYHPSGRPDEHDKILAELCSKPVEIISSAMGGTFKGVVTFNKSIDEGSRYHTEYDVDIVEVPEKKTNIPGENQLVVPAIKKETKKDSEKDNKLNTALGKCKLPFRKGQKDKCVKTLQEKLISLNYLKKKNKTGVYDTNTVKAVRNFQKSTKKLKTTGIVDKSTMNYLIKDNSSSKKKGTTKTVTKGNLNTILKSMGLK